MKLQRENIKHYLVIIFFISILVGINYSREYKKVTDGYNLECYIDEKVKGTAILYSNVAEEHFNFSILTPVQHGEIVCWIPMSIFENYYVCRGTLFDPNPSPFSMKVYFAFDVFFYGLYGIEFKGIVRQDVWGEGVIIIVEEYDIWR